MGEAARWVSCGRHTFRFDLARRFTEEMSADGMLSGITVVLGPDCFTVDKGDGAESLRSYITQNCSPVILTEPSLVYSEDCDCPIIEPDKESNLDTSSPGGAG